jgi:hypothetical protein
MFLALVWSLTSMFTGIVRAPCDCHGEFHAAANATTIDIVGLYLDRAEVAATYDRLTSVLPLHCLGAAINMVAHNGNDNGAEPQSSVLERVGITGPNTSGDTTAPSTPSWSSVPLTSVTPYALSSTLIYPHRSRSYSCGGSSAMGQDYEEAPLCRIPIWNGVAARADQGATV